jgi:RNA polymerase sigma-70 factor (ECF subfamily)
MGRMTKKNIDLMAAKNLDKDVLTAIFDQYAPILYRYALRLCSDPREADQIVGDVFSRLLEQLALGKGPQTNLRSYLFQIAYHVVVDRARERQRTAPLDVAENILVEEKSLLAIVEEQALLDELQGAIQDGLTEEQRHIIILRYQEEFSLRETAEIVGKNVNAVKALQNRGITKLRLILNKKRAMKLL